MANVFAEKATKYVDILDEVYKREAMTSMLDIAPEAMQFDGTKFVKIPKVVVDGAVDYDRAGGYDTGSVAVTWTSHEIKYDRGRKFGVDILDDDELAFNVFATATTEYVRTRQIPEIDAIRFHEIATQASAGDATVVSSDDLTTNPLGLLDTAEQVLADNEVNLANSVIFISNEYYNALKNDDAVSRRLDVGNVSAGGINRSVQTFDGIPLIKVPRGRFYDSIDLATTGAGGFAPSAGAHELNFVFADKSALLGIKKAMMSKVFTWQENQLSDENIATYRDHHDLIIPSQKTKGIYIHKKATAFDA